MSLHIPRSPNSRICARNDAVGFHHACSLAAGRHLATEPPILLADRAGDRGACTSRRLAWLGRFPFADAEAAKPNAFGQGIAQEAHNHGPA
jgi:hypothetical protein